MNLVWAPDFIPSVLFRCSVFHEAAPIKTRTILFVVVVLIGNSEIVFNGEISAYIRSLLM